jgi:hypothetical protein
MDKALFHLIYVSTAREELSVAELDRILESAAKHNAVSGVTGVLLYAGGTFMQVLEGGEAEIDETFSRIREDPRHSSLIVIERTPVAERSFAQWSMGFRRVGATEAAAHPAWAPFFDPGFCARELGAKPGVALDMLKDFVRNQREGRFG